MQQQQQQTQQYKLLDPPSDGIASLEFSPVDPYLLLAASWDKVGSWSTISISIKVTYLLIIHKQQLTGCPAVRR